jgi:chromosome segregation protein
LRLTHLKLAGFKSFVDPTTIHLHGQRVGVVGPNGCGKSNVMESVRWVLGESSAKEMRADAMDAVIFNGSSNRNPISRASVELIFDNSLGGASGEWNQYAEISVKRVIERQKGSSYYINNTAVRRRDVADLFLGTGLGGRAYAIIGQNTISRIVEAKPEELRVFLEEAAGISKYKERRRETEMRLRDTRENLTRVEDICRELQKQITKLESQAVVTQKYHALQENLKLAEGQFWVLKKRDASQSWEKTKTNVEKLVIELEAQTAKLRKSEAELEASRQSFYNAGEAINAAQAAYYESNAEVANLENQVKQNAEARERMTHQLQQLEESLLRNTQTKTESNEKLAQLNASLNAVSNKELDDRAALDALKLDLPEKEAAFKAAVKQLEASTSSVQEAKQRIQIDTNNLQHLDRSIQDSLSQIERLEHTLSQLNIPDETVIQLGKQQLAQAQENVANIELGIQKMRAEEDSIRNRITKLREQQNQEQRAHAQVEAEMHSLEKIQQSLNAGGKLSDWLNSKGLKGKDRLWEMIKIEDSWSVALEAILGERLNALLSEEMDIGDRPPGTLALGFPGLETQTFKTNSQLTPLISVVTDAPSALKAILDDWLAGCYLLPESEDGLKASKALSIGERLVNKQGDVFSRSSLVYHGENSSLHGVIERQQQLESLKKSLPDLQEAVAKTAKLLNEDESALGQFRTQQQQENGKLKTAMQTLHQQQLDIAKLAQHRDATISREKSLKTDIELAKNRYTQLSKDVASRKATLQEIAGQVDQLELTKNADFDARQHAEKLYLVLRDAVAEAEKKYQETLFEIKIINNSINELRNKINVIDEEKDAFVLRKAEAEKALNLTPMDTLKANLSNAVTVKQAKETALSEARNHLESQEAQLKELERMRMQHEQELNPMRDKVEQSRLNEQEARLYFEQCQTGLQENGMDEQVLLASLDQDAKVSTFANKTSQLEKEIEALGPVNLAAIQELESEVERKTYLDSQMQDLMEASETLESAIHKIDRETREKLLETFNKANQHFGELFATLFGGGQAKLELLGEEILDTGLQVFAQPPGKKNTTIQLLSGGEKALTALALVFALFRLNPAPFCLMDEVDAPLDDSNTERFCSMVKKMSEKTQFLFVSHNKITMEIAQQLIGVTMQESGVSRIVDVDIETALQMQA